MTATDASQGLDSSSTGDVACQKEDCSCPEGQEPAGSCVDGEFVCECFATSCPFEEIVCQMVEDGEVSIDDIVDCGTLTLMDDAAAWEAGQTCVLDAFAGERAYKVFAEQQGIDSTVWRALGGLIGFVYQPVEYYYDGGGFDGSEQVTMRNCAPVLLDDCIVEPGLLCIACAENEDSSQICFAPGE